MTDFSSLPRQHRHTVARRRDRFDGKTRPDGPARRYKVRFSKDLNRFVTSVAHALRHRIKYRSDSGEVARGLVLDSDPARSLYRIHWNGKHEYGWREGEWVWLWALVHRRVADRPRDRWAVAIEFEIHATFKDFGGDVVAPLNPTERVEEFLGQLRTLTAKVPGDQGRRLRAYAALAEKVGYPKLLDLWHYNEIAVKDFAWESAANQKAMIQKGGGLPPRGTLPGNWQGGPPHWRIYPFRSLLQGSVDGPVKLVRLKQVDRDVGNSIQALVSAPGGKGAGGEAAVSSEVRRFRAHLKQLAKTPGNLYFESDRNTADRRGIFEMLP